MKRPALFVKLCMVFRSLLHSLFVHCRKILFFRTRGRQKRHEVETASGYSSGDIPLRIRNLWLHSQQEHRRGCKKSRFFICRCDKVLPGNGCSPTKCERLPSENCCVPYLWCRNQVNEFSNAFGSSALLLAAHVASYGWK